MQKLLGTSRQPDQLNKQTKLVTQLKKKTKTLNDCEIILTYSVLMVDMRNITFRILKTTTYSKYGYKMLDYLATFIIIQNFISI